MITRPGTVRHGPQHTKNLWLLMLRRGGRWTCTELRMQLGMKSTDANTALARMWRYGLCARYDGKPCTFEVSELSLIPGDVCLSDILEAMKERNGTHIS